jgi:hypothetical protein
VIVIVIMLVVVISLILSSEDGRSRGDLWGSEGVSGRGENE